MFNLLNYSKYELPEGRGRKDPIVFVRKNVIRDIGMPEVNYEGLSELFYKDLRIPSERTPKIKLYGGSLAKRAVRAWGGNTVSTDMVYGFHTAYTNTVHVNASSTERSNNTMFVLAHEAQHLSDSRNFPLARAIEIAMGVGVINAGIEAAEATHFVPEVIGALTAREAWYAIQPAERRARAVQHSEIAHSHANDIVFPERNPAKRF